MYRVGDRVKIFVNCLSTHTETGIISHVKFLPDKNEVYYLVTLDNGNRTVLVGESEAMMEPYVFQLKL